MTERESERGSKQDREHRHEHEDAGLKARLDKLSDALDAHSGQRVPTSDQGMSGQGTDGPSEGSVAGAMSLGLRVLTEFVAAVVVGTLIGWQIDVWTGTAPIFLLLFLVFGTAAGFMNVYRIAMKPTGSKGSPR